MTLEEVEKITVDNAISLLILEGYGDSQVYYDHAFFKVRELQKLFNRHSVGAWPATSLRVNFAGGPPPAKVWYKTNLMNYVLDCLFREELRNGRPAVLKTFKRKVCNATMV